MEEVNKIEEKGGIWRCGAWEETYPDRLRCYEGMPGMLYTKGCLPQEEKKTVAIVGARACSAYGTHQAYTFAKILAEHGVQIISGLARGIDGKAHQGALDGGGKTFAALGCGVDICYPPEHAELENRILQTGGGVFSEFDLGTPPYAGNFPRRNRIISGLADLVLVVEAKVKSGSLITASFALEQGKIVYAVPGRVGDALSEGCNRLISDGAGVAYSVEPLLEELKIPRGFPEDFREKNKIGLASQEEMVYSCLDLHPKNLEDIVREIPLSAREITGLLLKLELKGLIEEPVKNYYARTGG